MSLEYGFDDRMQIGRAIAQERRNRGLPTGKPAKGWNAKRQPLEDTEENRLLADNSALRSQVRDLENQIAQIQLNGAEIEPIDDAGAEFDRLFASAKAVGPGLPAGPRSSPGSTTPARTRGAPTMTTNQYLAALKKLGLSPSGRGTAEALGLSLRQCQRIAAGDSPVPDTLAKLLAMYLEHGRPTA